jgi:hypothetical protein
MSSREYSTGQESRYDVREDVTADPRKRGVARQPLGDGQGRGPRPAADLDDRRRVSREPARDGLGSQPVVDLIEQVVVGEVVEPEG